MDIYKQCIERLREDKRCVDIVIARLETLALSRGLTSLKRLPSKPQLQLGDGNQ